MKNSMDAKPDHIPYALNEHQYLYTLKNLSESSPSYWYADENGIQTVGLAKKVLQTVKGFFGWLGAINYTEPKHVEYGLMKFLYYGYSQGYLRQEGFQSWVSGMSKSPEFSTTTRHMLGYLRDLPNYQFNEEVRTDLTEFLLGYNAEHKLSKGSPLSFGETPLIAGQRALNKGYPKEALRLALAAYNLRVKPTMKV